MNHNIFLSTMCVLLTLVPAYAESPDLPEQTTIGQKASPWLELALERILTYDRLATVLDSVNDKISAEAAVADTRQIVEQLQQLAERERQMEIPSADISAYVTNKLKNTDTQDLSERVVGKIIDLLAKTDPPCYGSRELSKELHSFAEILMTSDSRG